MSFICSVPNCKGNYRNGPRVSVFKFPEDDALKKAWLRNIHRDDFQPTKSSRMYLAAFDFDFTLTNDHSLQVFKNASQDKKSGLLATESLTDVAEYAVKYYIKLKAQGYNSKSILQTMQTVAITPGMDAVLRYLKNYDCEIIVISNNMSLIVEEWLKVHNLRHFFHKIYVFPSRLNDNDELQVEPYNTHNCKLSHKGMCKGDALESYIEERKKQGINFSKILYFGDTFTDLCPVLRLSEKDIVFPRKDFYLDKIINERNSSNTYPKVRAFVYPWTNGEDILEAISPIFSNHD